MDLAVYITDTGLIPHMTSNTKKIYIAGSLFKQGDIVQRLSEEKRIRELGRKVMIYNPISADINDKSRLPTASEIVSGDFGEILTSNGLLIAVDDVDMGVACEVGMCYGINYMLEYLSELIKKNKVSAESINDLLQRIPAKKLYGHHSDIRIGTAHEYSGNYVPYGANQFYIGALEKYGKIFPRYEEAIDELLKNL